MLKKYKPVVLVVLDGWGHREEKKDNAIFSANKPVFDNLWQNFPHSLLKASGGAVGLPEGQMGNSEVGHMTIGAGRPIDTDLVRINKAIKQGEFEENPVFAELFEHVKKNNSVLHVAGLLSGGGVHSHKEHLFTLLDLAKKNSVKRVAIHVFLDGRDTPPQSGAGYLRELEEYIKKLNGDSSVFCIATVSGRHYAMDRDKNWDRLAKVEDAIFFRKGELCDKTPSEFLEEKYKEGEKDELLLPFCVKGEDDLMLKANDAFFLFNYRADRARMITEKVLAKSINENILVGTMILYREDFSNLVAFPPIISSVTLGKEISKKGMKQARIAETEKFAHATYFLNCGNEKEYEGEKDLLIKSRDDIKTHDEAPEMRAKEIADTAISEIEKGEVDFIFINFANADMVGHTANVPAIVKGVECVDRELGRVIDALNKVGGIALITADHGNAEINIDPLTGEKHTAHTTSLVPFIITSHDFNVSDGELKDLAPSVLFLLDIEKPTQMTGNSLLQ
ncbi:MAG: 2,3-bisphosphoglycerate-independent phosphoglycerate mutase [Candidatus Paceibacterota bacterium]|jgi:2,3-bisphosphoglycerate-independent phosphoglycerate mutase